MVAVAEVDVDVAALHVEAIATIALRAVTLAVLAPTVGAMAPADTVVVLVAALAAEEAGAGTGNRPTLFISKSSYEQPQLRQAILCFGTSPHH